MTINDKRQMAVVEQFNRDSGLYLSKHVRPETNRETQRIFELVNPHKRFQSALDLGCGPGTLTEEMSQICKEVWGVDCSAKMITVARAKLEHSQTNNAVHFEVGSAEQLHFKDESFDLVVCAGVLRYLGSWEKGLNEIYRVLKPNGVLVTTFYYRFSIQWFSMCLLNRPLLPLISLLKGRPLQECLTRYKAEPLPFSYRKFQKVFARIGFTNIECQHSGFEVYPLRRLFPRVSQHIYLYLESLYHKSNTFGWMGSICIVKGVKNASTPV